MLEPARLLVVDDNAEGRALLRRVLESEGHVVVEACDGQDALDKIELGLPSLVLTDVVMPRMDGYELCRRLKGEPRTRLTPVIMLTALDQLPDRVKALELDADDYLIKPYNLTVLRARVRSLLRLRHTLDEMENAAAVLQSVAELVEMRDAYTSTHCRDVAYLAVELGQRLGLDEAALGRLRLAATFHDIGKFGVPDAVLRKAGPLNADERKAMQTHAALGMQLLLPMRTMHGIVQLVRHHHERLDGSGYPDGISGEALSLELRVLTVVDIYHALIGTRSYKPAFTPQQALGILSQEAERGWWDVRVVEALASLLAVAPQR